MKKVRRLAVSGAAVTRVLAYMDLRRAIERTCIIQQKIASLQHQLVDAKRDLKKYEKEWRAIEGQSGV